MNNIIKPLLDLTHDQLSKFANLEDSWQQFGSIFGTQYDRTVAVDLRSQSQASDFSQLPEVEILDNPNGADASNSNKINLSASLLTTTTPEISAVLLKDDIATTPTGTTPQEATSVASGDYRIDSLLGGYKWGVTNISYSFYSGGSYYGSEGGLASVSEAVKNNVRTILANFISPLINLNFVEVPDSAASYGQIRYLLSTDPSYAYAYYPFSTDTNQGNSNDVAGDVFFNSSYDNTFDTNGIQGGPGTHGYQTIIHETLHALGIKHPGNYNGSGVGDPPYLPFGEDNWDNSLMTYNFNSGAEPSTPMAYDVLALQYLYGAKSFNSTNTTYTFTFTDLYSDGVRTVGSSTLDNKITIWDSGGTDTLNFAGLGFNATGYRFDLNAGGWLSTQTAFNGTGYNVSAGPPVTYSNGTTYYATTSGSRIAYGVTIENLINSSSNDYIIANSAANVFSGYGFPTATGNDTIEGADNLDTLDLSAFTSASVTQTQSGNNLVLGLGSGRSVTVKDYYFVPAGSRLNIQFSSLGTLSIVKTTDGAETGTVGSVFTLTRTGDLSAALNVSYSLGGTATVGSDYTDSGAGTVSFAAGSATATITLPTIDDAVVDPNETIIASITAPTGYTISGSNTATATIADNDSLATSVTLAVGPSGVLEDGVANLVYTFTRTGDTTNALSVNYAVGGTATFNTDYTQIGGQISTSTFTTPRGTITFAAGANTANLTINPTADTTVESNETVALRLTKGFGYDIGTATAVVGTIINDDLNDSLKASVTLAVSPSSVTEDGTTNLVYTFTRTGDTTNALTANYAVGGTAIFNSDYTQTGATSFASTNGSITFAAGVNTANIIIDPTTDSIIESNESVAIRLVAGTGYSIGTTTARIGTIINDDFSSVLTPSSVFGGDQSLFLSAGLLTSSRDFSLVA
ncbi:Calx-beta domain-containing protein [Trichormus variabilis]|uniref:Peptidase metallopeptidase domain-containing protein n=1 Tax=Trichormus variabilis SAG 1403-4b TaxID=447716 RepID=A0A433UNS0_ANAVA|nr:Calx-beta domain-containing protein [Trichormus variabilis]MBD2626982.1 M10 family metallopeptidase C-terminal domain-containing protein [Trichormus variabilis FACHB-164]RUS95487.1 hypothetical protein DSM107003_31900 [Trichormus variabilis SAG 1403-4b]